LDHLEGVVKRRRRGSYDGEAIRDHAERRAEELIQVGLSQLKMSMKEVRDMKKSDPRKPGWRGW